MNKGINMIAMLCLLLGIPAYASVPAPVLVIYPVIQLPEAASQSAEQPLRLGDIARVLPADLEGVEGPLVATRLARPLFHDQSWVQRDEIAAWLNSQIALDGVQVLGPERVRIRHAVPQDIAHAVIAAGAQSLEKYAAESWPDGYRNLSFQFLGKPADLKIPRSATWNLDATHLRNLGPRAAVNLEINDGQSKRAVVLWYEVKGEAQVWVALANMAPRQVAKPEDFRSDWISINHPENMHFARPDPMQRLKTGLHAGAVLTRRNMESVPAVEFGESVAVRFGVPGIRLMTVATAQQTAFVGQVINLTSDSSDETFKGKVVAPGMVEVVATHSYGGGR